MSLVSSVFKQVSCALTKHSVSTNDEDRLFESSNDFLDTQCEKCQTPIRLTKDKNTDEYFFVSELRYMEIKE